MRASAAPRTDRPDSVAAASEAVPGWVQSVCAGRGRDIGRRHDAGHRPHSARKASIGFTRTALTTGRRQATSAASASTTGATASAAGSVAVTP